MTLPIEMRSLTLDLLNSYDARMAKVTDIRTNVRQELSDFHAVRQAMTTGQQQRLDTFLNGLHREVDELRHATTRLLQGMDSAHRTMTVEQQQWLNEHMDRLHHAVIELRRQAATLLKDLDSAHQTMAAGQRQQLSEQMYRLRHRVGKIRRDGVSFLKDLHTAQQAMAAEQQQRLAAERAQLASEVATLRGRLQAEQSALRAAKGEARQVWSNFNVLKRQSRAKRRQADLSATSLTGSKSPAADAPAKKQAKRRR